MEIIPLQVYWEDAVSIVNNPATIKNFQHDRSFRTNFGALLFCDEEILVLAEDVNHTPHVIGGGYHILPRGMIVWIKGENGKRISWTRLMKLAERIEL
jgi:hypothetical protein